jgi:hypothetical protein
MRCAFQPAVEPLHIGEESTEAKSGSFIAKEERQAQIDIGTTACRSYKF